MINLATKDNPLTTEHIAQKMANKGIEVSSRTVRNRLQEKGFRYLAMTKKPLLSLLHMQSRVSWVVNNKNRDWSRVIFSDETTVRLSYYMTRVWKRRGETKVVRTKKHEIKVNL